MIGLIYRRQWSQAGRHHPEEQGLKLKKLVPAKDSTDRPVGIIQKNKDWNLIDPLTLDFSP